MKVKQKETKGQQPSQKEEKAKEIRQAKKALSKGKDFINDLFTKAKETKKANEEKKKTKEEEKQRIREEIQNMRKIMKKDAAKFAGEKVVDPNRRTTEDGLPIYTFDELKIGKGGNTSLCPFDCDCCF